MALIDIACGHIAATLAAEKKDIRIRQSLCQMKMGGCVELPISSADRHSLGSGVGPRHPQQTIGIVEVGGEKP